MLKVSQLPSGRNGSCDPYSRAWMMPSPMNERSMVWSMGLS
ncbi:hypothetical protein [Pseudomonas aeruginosa]